MVGKGILYGIGVVILVISGVIAWQTYEKSGEGGLEAKDFTLPRLDQEGMLTLSDYRGKVVVLNFWASWCVPCQEESLGLQAVWEEYQSKDVAFIGVNAYDNREDALAFIAAYDLTYPNVFDEDDAVAERYYVYALPVTAIVDQDGYIREVMFHAVTRAELHEKIDAAFDS